MALALPAASEPRTTPSIPRRAEYDRASACVPRPPDARETARNRALCYRRNVFFEELIRALDERGVRYALVGGVAVNLHGVPRMTYDVDMVVPMDVATLLACRLALVGLGLVCRLPLVLEALADASERARLEKERNLIAVTFTDPENPLREVDVLVAPSIDPDGVVTRSLVRSAGDFDVRIASVADLLRMKRAAARPQDLADVAHLERILEGA